MIARNGNNSKMMIRDNEERKHQGDGKENDYQAYKKERQAKKKIRQLSQGGERKGKR